MIRSVTLWSECVQPSICFYYLPGSQAVFISIIHTFCTFMNKIIIPISKNHDRRNDYGFLGRDFFYSFHLKQPVLTFYKHNLSKRYRFEDQLRQHNGKSSRLVVRKLWLHFQLPLYHVDFLLAKTLNSKLPLLISLSVHKCVCL